MVGKYLDIHCKFAKQKIRKNNQKQKEMIEGDETSFSLANLKHHVLVSRAGRTVYFVLLKGCAIHRL